MSSTTAQSHKHESARMDNSTYNILSAAGREADFLYSTVDQYIEDARKEGRPHLVDLWNEMKQDKQKYLNKLTECLEKEAKENKLCC